MADKKADYDVSNLTKIVTTIGEFSTELTCEEVEARIEEAKANGGNLEFHSLITEMSFGNRINTCKELIKIDLRHVHILALKAIYDMTPKLNERQLLEKKEKRTEQEEARLKELQSRKDQGKTINSLEKSVAELELDKKEKELTLQEIELKEEIQDLDEQLKEKDAD